MNLNLTEQDLTVELTKAERFWACHLSKTITIPRSQIQQVGSTMPPLSWRVIRSPGTSIPWQDFAAGTFYTEHGREFWYITQSDRVLTVALDRQNYYKRLILTVDDPQAWVARLSPPDASNAPSPE